MLTIEYQVITATYEISGSELRRKSVKPFKQDSEFFTDDKRPYMDSSCLASATIIKIKTRTYIRFLSGYANS